MKMTETKDKKVLERMQLLQAELDRTIQLRTVKPCLTEDYEPFPRYYLFFCSINNKANRISNLTTDEKQELRDKNDIVSRIVDKTAKRFGMNVYSGHEIVPRRKGFTREGLGYYTFKSKYKTR